MLPIGKSSTYPLYLRLIQISVQACLMYLVSKWWSSTAQSVRMFIIQNLLATIIPTALTLALDFLTCCLWFIPIVDLNDQAINLFPGFCTFRFLFPYSLSINGFKTLILCRLFGFKVHPMALQLQYQSSTQKKSSGKVRHWEKVKIQQKLSY